MWKDLKLIHSFTLEASFCGASAGPLGGLHFTPNDFEVSSWNVHFMFCFYAFKSVLTGSSLCDMIQDIGKNFCLGLYDLINADQTSVFSALTDVYRSLAGKKALPVPYPHITLPLATVAPQVGGAGSKYLADSNNPLLTKPAGGQSEGKKGKKKSTKKKSKKSKS